VYNYTSNIPIKIGDIKPLIQHIKHPISYQIPKLVYDELMCISNEKTEFILRKVSLLSAETVKNSIFNTKNSMFSFLRFLDMPFNFLEFVWNTD